MATIVDIGGGISSGVKAYANFIESNYASSNHISNMSVTEINFYDYFTKGSDYKFTCIQECDAVLCGYAYGYATAGATDHNGDMFVNDINVQHYTGGRSQNQVSKVKFYTTHFNVGDNFYYKTSNGYGYPRQLGWCAIY